MFCTSKTRSQACSPSWATIYVQLLQLIVLRSVLMLPHLLLYLPNSRLSWDFFHLFTSCIPCLIHASYALNSSGSIWFHYENNAIVHSVFSEDCLLRIVASILNRQSPRCYRQYKKLSCVSFYGLHLFKCFLASLWSTTTLSILLKVR
jgi:hypothetical protein